MKRTIAALALAAVLAFPIGAAAQALCPCIVYVWYCTYSWFGYPIYGYSTTTDSLNDPGTFYEFPAARVCELVDYYYQ